MNRKALPLLASDARSAPDPGIDLLCINASLYLATCQAPHSVTGSDPVVNADNIVHLSRLTFVDLCVFARVSAFARLSCSVSCLLALPIALCICGLAKTLST